MNESAESAFSAYTKKAKKTKKHKISPKVTNGIHLTACIEKNAQVVEALSTIVTSKKSKKKRTKPSSLNESGTSPDIASVAPLPKKIKLKHSVPSVEVEKKVKTLKSFVDLKNPAISLPEKAKQLLSWILYPMQVSTFFETHWESKPFHVKRHESDYYTSLLSSKDIDLMLREHPLFFGRNVDVVEYKDGVRETVNPEGRATPSIVWDAYAQGCSVRILNPQTYNSTVHYVLATLQEYFGTMVGANVYLTPAGSQGFAPHYDDIEAFILQLEGKKRWKLYKPLNEAENLARFSSKDFGRDQLGDLVFDAILNAGDILYFPRGMVHEAKTVPDEHSLHMTISSYQRTCYADLMDELIPKALQSAAHTDIEFRKGLPLNYLKHVGTSAATKQTPERVEILKTVQRLFFKLASSIDVDEAADAMGRKFMHDALPPVKDHAEEQCSSILDGDRLEHGKIVNSVEITLDTEIRLLRYYACRFVKEKDQGMLYFSTQNARVYHGEEEQFVVMDLELGVIIEVLQLHYPDFVPICHLPVDDKEKLLSFIMQLWDYGIIVTSKPSSC